MFQPIQRFASALGTVIPSDAWRPSAGWVDRELEAAFKTRFNASALSDPVPPHLEWMLAAGEPCYAQLLGSPALGAPGCGCDSARNPRWVREPAVAAPDGQQGVGEGALGRGRGSATPRRSLRA